jgi:hypothetical protein
MSYRQLIKYLNKIAASLQSANIRICFILNVTIQTGFALPTIQRIRWYHMRGEIIGGIRKIKLGKVLSVDESIAFWVNIICVGNAGCVEPDLIKRWNQVTRRLY